ncbi:MAG: hypothetical protein HY318_20830, partial [Armatimonadetes bacterium]|nr:hypothetical protein [Armatimonadota bacterium]
MQAESTGAVWPAIVALFFVFTLRSAGTTAPAEGTLGSSGLWVVPLDGRQWEALPEEVRSEELPRPLTILDGPGSVRVPADGPAYSVYES